MNAIADITTLAALAEPLPDRLGHYVRLFAVVATLLGAFMLGIMLIGYLRRRRLAGAERRRLGHRSGDPRDEETIPDAWTEAGRRDAPYSGTATPRRGAAQESTSAQDEGDDPWAESGVDGGTDGAADEGSDLDGGTDDGDDESHGRSDDDEGDDDLRPR